MGLGSDPQRARQERGIHSATLSVRAQERNEFRVPGKADMRAAEVEALLRLY
jgi:hypothetical protein